MTDESLMREALEAMKALLPEYETWVMPLREASGWENGGPHIQRARASIAKLEERLLQD